MRFDTVVRHGTVVFPARPPAQLDIAIKDGVIAAIAPPGQDLPAADVIDATGRHIFPGLIDAHVHFGFAEPVTEYTSETITAALGGFTTVIGYFLNNEGYGGVFEREIGHAGPRAPASGDPGWESLRAHFNFSGSADAFSG